jgi:hypothetical protein
MVAAMAAMILAVVLGVGNVVGDMLFHGCQEISAQAGSGGECVAPEAPAAGQHVKGGSAPVVAPVSSTNQTVDDDQQAPGTNDLGGGSDDM